MITWQTFIHCASRAAKRCHGYLVSGQFNSPDEAAEQGRLIAHGANWTQTDGLWTCPACRRQAEILASLPDFGKGAA